MIPVDVIISYEDMDADAAATCAAAFEREGWSVYRSDGHGRVASYWQIPGARAPGNLPSARAHVVIWSETSIHSARLARENREPLEHQRLLQLLVQPRRAPGETFVNRENTIEPPEPFCFHQGLPLHPYDVDGSERAIDAFASSQLDGDRILKAVARLGGLKRPSDGWNARIVFSKPMSGDRVEAVTVSEYAAEDGRLLRRFGLDHNGTFLETPYETAIGSRWRVTTRRQGVVVADVLVSEGKTRVDLPRRTPWWQRWLRR